MLEKKIYSQKFKEDSISILDYTLVFSLSVTYNMLLSVI